MRVAIKFDYQSSGGAIEVGDVQSQRMLAPKFEPGQLTVFQLPPKSFFGGRRFPPHLTGKFNETPIG